MAVPTGPDSLQAQRRYNGKTTTLHCVAPKLHTLIFNCWISISKSTTVCQGCNLYRLWEKYKYIVACITCFIIHVLIYSWPFINGVDSTNRKKDILAVVVIELISDFVSKPVINISSQYIYVGLKIKLEALVDYLSLSHEHASNCRWKNDK